jgi:hypothetical protein
MCKDEDVKEVQKPEKGLFNFFWNASDAVIKGAKKPFKVNALKRAFKSAYEDASIKIIDLESKIDDYRKQLTSIYDDTKCGDIINQILESKNEIWCLKEQQKDIIVEYEKMFDKTMKVDEEE